MTVVGRAGKVIITNDGRVSPRLRQNHALAAPSQREPWHDRHQVCSSRDNVRLNPLRRDYFDVLPTVHVRQGQYHQTWKRFAASDAVFSEQRLELERLFERHPMEPCPKEGAVLPIKDSEPSKNDD